MQNKLSKKDPLGSGWMIIAALAFTLMNIWVKEAGNRFELGSGELVFWRMSFAALVLGISVDSAWCHQAFRDARKLHFDLLSDYEPKGEVSRAYVAYDAEAGCSKRALFVIDAEGKIAWSYLSPVAINPGVDGVLDALDRL